MKRATYKDETGRIWVTSIPDEAPESMAPLGVPVGPPDTSDLGLPDAVAIRLHNELARRRLFTAADVRRRTSEVVGALQAALRVDAGKIVAAYVRVERGEGEPDASTEA